MSRRGGTCRSLEGLRGHTCCPTCHPLSPPTRNGVGASAARCTPSHWPERAWSLCQSEVPQEEGSPARRGRVRCHRGRRLTHRVSDKGDLSTQ